jgi:hypothetical protein
MQFGNSFFVETVSSYKSRPKANYGNEYTTQDLQYCERIASIDPVHQVNAFGKYICGKKSTFSFSNANRPNSENQCAEN